ncbi:hypothetical protein Pcinc_043623, partial [Petrolisthes cinctipes]
MQSHSHALTGSGDGITCNAGRYSGGSGGGSGGQGLEVSGGSGGQGLEVSGGSGGQGLEVSGGSGGQGLEVSGGSGGQGLEVSGGSGGQGLEVSGGSGGQATMTVQYTHKIAQGNSFLSFMRLLRRWQGSVYKVVWPDMLLYSVFYTTISLIYRLVLSEEGR